MSDLKREDVARVLAKEWREEQKSRSGGVRGGTPVKIRIGAFALLTDLADELNIRPEFESALAEMESKEAERG